MFYVRVAIGQGDNGTTPANLFALYGVSLDRLEEVLDASHNDPLRAAVPRAAVRRKNRQSGGPNPIEPNDDLLQAATPQGRQGLAICLPIGDYPIELAWEPSFKAEGHRAGKVNAAQSVPSPKKQLTPKDFLWWTTHALDVAFGLYNPGGSLYVPAPRLRWVQTVTREYHHKQQPPLELREENIGHKDEFIDVHKHITVPWYNHGIAVDPGTLTDTPAGPEAPPGWRRGYWWRGTASLTVETGPRVTLVQSYTYGFHVETGRSKAAVILDPAPRPATQAEVAKHLQILGAKKNAWGKLVGGPSLDYRPTPPAGTVA